MRQYFFTSAPMKIGPKEWRIVVYTERDHETEMATERPEPQHCRSTKRSSAQYSLPLKRWAMTGL